FLLFRVALLVFFTRSFYRSGLGPSRHAAIFRADHFHYLASVGIIALVSGWAAAVLNRASRSWRIIGYAGCVALLITVAALTWRQSRLYRDSETMFSDVVSKNPDSPTAHNNLG